MDQIEAQDIYFTQIQLVMDWVNNGKWADEWESFEESIANSLDEMTGNTEIDLVGGMPRPFKAALVQAWFEQFLVMNLPTRRRSPLEAYLHAKRKRLAANEAEFLDAFKNSSMSLYEVVERRPGVHVILKDLYRDGARVKIEDCFAALLWTKRDIVAIRIAIVGGKPIQVGPFFGFERKMRRELLQGLDAIAFDTEAQFLAAVRGIPFDAQAAREEAAPVMALVLSCGWAAAMYSVLAEYDRNAYAEDAPADDLVYISTLFSKVASSDEIFKKLESVSDLVRVPCFRPVWFWYRNRADEDEPMKATVWIGPVNLIIDGCSRNDVTEVATSLKNLLGDFIGDPVVQEIPIEADEESDEASGHEVRIVPFEPMDDEEIKALRERVRRDLDQKFRLMLYEPVPELGNQVPRKLVNSVAGRKRLAKWIHSLELYVQDHAYETELEDYDLSWIWTELGLGSPIQANLFE